MRVRMAGEGAEELDKLRKTVRSVLLSSPKGVQLKKFCADYRGLVKETFPWKRLGYSSVVHLLEAMPDVVRFEFSAKHNDYRLFGIADSSCYLPSWLLKAQGKNKPSPLAPFPPPPSQRSPASSSHGQRHSNTASSSHGQRPSNIGLITVHVSFKAIGGDQVNSGLKTLGVTKQKLRQVMRAAGNPLDVYLDERGFAFVRYATLKEAKNAIDTCSGRVVGGARLVVEPARESENLFPQFRSQKKEGRRRGGKKKMRDDRRKREEKRRLREEGGKSEERAGVSANVSRYGTAAEGDSSGWGGESLPARTEDHRKSCNLKSSNAGIISWSPDQSCDHSYPGQSESGSDLDSDFWDDDLLTASPSSADSCSRPVTIPYQETASALDPDPERVTPASCGATSQLKLSERNSPLENGLTAARVSIVDSPSIIWLQLTADPEGDITRLSQWIAQEDPPQLTQVKEGQFCALKLLPLQFVRVRVDQFDNCVVKQQVTVLWIDTGHTQIVSCHSLYSLPSSASLPTVPPLAMPCRLGGVRSTFASGGWYFLDNQLLWMYLLKKKVYVRKRQQSNISSLDPALPRVEVDLFLDATGTESAAECLVRKGLHVALAQPKDATSPAAVEGGEVEGCCGHSGHSGGAVGVLESARTSHQSSHSRSPPLPRHPSLPPLSSSPLQSSPLICTTSCVSPPIHPSAISPSHSSSSSPVKPPLLTTSSSQSHTHSPSLPSSFPPPLHPPSKPTPGSQSSTPFLRLQKLLENLPTKLS